ncbi:hypothetical protein GH714_019864 [Hevea brasiliensis]|uniref:Uncharacterized protein n=1 Tax=Hevea brasiliensis TaxID=3981 RepID=A0A6A6K618_HEVBR|nr:hypothetical protein GH714_019864 [Hevea brasiliensis]
MTSAAKTQREISMEKFAEDLNNRFLSMPEAIKGSKSSSAGNEDGEEAKSESMEKVSVEEKAINDARGPTRPTPPKGPPPQTA